MFKDHWTTADTAWLAIFVAMAIVAMFAPEISAVAATLIVIATGPIN